MLCYKIQPRKKNVIGDIETWYTQCVSVQIRTHAMLLIRVLTFAWYLISVLMSIYMQMFLVCSSVNSHRQMLKRWKYKIYFLMIFPDLFHLVSFGFILVKRIKKLNWVFILKIWKLDLYKALRMTSSHNTCLVTLFTSLNIMLRKHSLRCTILCNRHFSKIFKFKLM